LLNNAVTEERLDAENRIYTLDPFRKTTSTTYDKAGDVEKIIVAFDGTTQIGSCYGL